MDDPELIAAKYAKEVNDTIDGAAQVANEAYAKINAEPSTFGTRDAIKSLSDLTKIAIKGAADIARIPLQSPPDPRVLLLADHITTVIRRGLLEATEVATEAANLVDKDPAKVDRDELVKSAVKVVRIGMLRTAEIAQTIAAGPGAYSDPVLYSDDIAIAPKPYDRKLAVTNMARKAVPKEDIRKHVGFDLANSVLPANVTSFRLVANSAGLCSGVYIGEVTAHTLDTNALDDTVEVLFAL
ncbi:hypothetical protein A5731_25515 [Mycolicibacterium conceptionense]|uniref:Uncharacterized protein n=1 Tax=Mycolicibacterium conceptionense TaxID=451644 RepID=A0A0U1DBK2_9MYCO|nr:MULTISPECIES: hypothetical protein [Mycolicibacterium]MCW1822587.1 hypothetical protein [Mycolicibacterium senegalense]OBB09450.1 hypothetical protein A5718_11020 [Mycolicibacterium conceptionense]OBE96147.1 hypothetical protein A5731_25515 [Mycolicibacterium conceptionense]OBF27595.1 hypothetical protein A5726_03645 [Mycolicibacterium conceptionense]OBF45425.1 hypothetical protein A5720_10990 [Mycolicibacterium conceptionense]